jgi:hypothetical protein
MEIIDNRDEAIEFIKKYFNNNVITCEIGFFRGEYSKKINQILNPIKHSVIDIFDGICESGDQNGYNVQSQDMFLMEEYSRSLGYITIKGTSFDLENINDDINFIYIDASHSYDWVYKDLVNSFNKLKSGSIVSGHDYCQHSFIGCFNAVNDFCNDYNQKIEIITKDKLPSFFIKVDK